MGGAGERSSTTPNSPRRRGAAHRPRPGPRASQRRPGPSRWRRARGGARERRGESGDLRRARAPRRAHRPAQGRHSPEPLGALLEVQTRTASAAVGASTSLRTADGKGGGPTSGPSRAARPRPRPAALGFRSPARRRRFRCAESGPWSPASAPVRARAASSLRTGPDGTRPRPAPRPPLSLSTALSSPPAEVPGAVVVHSGTRDCGPSFRFRRLHFYIFLTVKWKFL